PKLPRPKCKRASSRLPLTGNGTPGKRPKPAVRREPKRAAPDGRRVPVAAVLLLLASRLSQIFLSFMCALFLVLSLLGAADETQQARADRAQWPQAEWGYLYYLSTTAAPAEHRAALARTTAFVVASASRAVVIERQLPQQVGDSDLYRIDLRGLEWDWRDWRQVLERYPYAPDRHPPLVVRADWLLVELTDAFASDSYYRLL